MVSTLARIHPKGNVPLILASQTSLVKLQPVPKSLHMNRDLTVLESQKGGSALSIFCCVITHLCCERATAMLTKPETSEMKMMTGVAINVAENNARNIWTDDHSGPTSRPGSVLLNPIL